MAYKAFGKRYNKASNSADTPRAAAENFFADYPV
jgi:hypothetical protein